MQETKDPKSTESVGASQSAESKDPKADATSKETLSDVEETEKVSETDKNEAPVSPSPDGAFDEGRGASDGLEDAGPM